MCSIKAFKGVSIYIKHHRKKIEIKYSYHPIEAALVFISMCLYVDTKNERCVNKFLWMVIIDKNEKQ